MRRFNTYEKYQACQAICVVLAALAVICLYKLYNSLYYSHEVKKWFLLLMIDVVVLMPFGVAFYYYRAKNANSDPQNEALEVFAHIEHQKRHDGPR